MGKDFLFIVVDDVSMNNLLCRFVIETACKDAEVGAEVIEFTEASKALEYLKDTFRITTNDKEVLLLLDLYMPIMDGWDFLNEYEKLPDLIKSRIKLFVLTSSISEADKVKATTYSSIAGYFTKPFGENEVRYLIG